MKPEQERKLNEKQSRKKDERFHFPLSAGLVGIILVCWILPIILIFTAISGYVSDITKRQIGESIEESVANAAYISQRSLKELIDSSRELSYDKDFETLYYRYIRNNDRQEFYNHILKLLKTNYQYDNNIDFALLILLNETENIYHIQNPSNTGGYSEIIKYKNNVQPTVLEISETLGRDFGFVNYENNMYMIRNIVDKNYSPYAIVVFKLNLPDVFTAFNSHFFDSNNYIYLNNVPVVVSQNADAGELAVPDFPEEYISPGNYRVSEKGDSYHIYGRYKLDRLEFKYITEIDKEGLFKMPEEFYFLILVVILLLIPFLTVAIWFFYRNIFKPIKQLNEASKTISKGGLGYELSHNMYNTEFTSLRDNFNSMSRRLKRQFEKIYSEELALRDARIMALQSQINPHFLNNTLEIINWEARFCGNEKISDMIESLSIMLDAAMDRKGAPLINLSQELVYVEAYFHIIKQRFGKRLSVEREIEEETLSIKIPRLLLQPIIENAVEHGMTPEQTCEILIKSYVLGEFMYIEVINNTALSDEDKLRIEKLLDDKDNDDKTTGSLHLGIRNVNERLKMIYGKEAGLEIYGMKNQTISKLTIPNS